MDRVHLVFQFIGLDEITMEVCRQRGSPRTEPRLTSSMGRWGDRNQQRGCCQTNRKREPGERGYRKLGEALQGGGPTSWVRCCI